VLPACFLWTIRRSFMWIGCSVCGRAGIGSFVRGSHPLGHSLCVLLCAGVICWVILLWELFVGAVFAFFFFFRWLFVCALLCTLFRWLYVGIALPFFVREFFMWIRSEDLTG
jgi:hypothetical protein